MFGRWLSDKGCNADARQLAKWLGRSDSMDKGRQGMTMTTKWTQLAKALVREDDGQSLIEYALVAGIIALGAIAALTLLKNQIATAFNYIGNTLKNAV